MTGRSAAARRVDVARLPADVADLVDGLGPGEELVVTRDGVAIAAITRACAAPPGEPAALSGTDTLTGADQPTETGLLTETDSRTAADEPADERVSPAPAEPPEPTVHGDDVTVVATAMKLSAAARRALAVALGPGYVVLDMRAAPTTADVLLVPPASPQLVGNIRSLFPRARVIVTEIDDPDLGVSYQGSVRRLLDAGAETYLAATTVPRLAAQLDHAVTRRALSTGGADPGLAIEPDDPAAPFPGRPRAIDP